jgi:hypothetical protein
VWKGSLLNRASCLALIKSTLCAIPVYLYIALEIPPWVQKALEKIFKAFLWAGSDVVPGIMNLRFFGSPLRSCWLWLQRSDPSHPWASLKVKEDKINTAFFKASMFFVLGDGRNALFWSDAWLEGKSFIDFAPNLVAAVSKCRRVRRTVCTALHHDDWISDITGECTMQVIMQYLDVRHRVSDVVLNPNAPDLLICR